MLRKGLIVIIWWFKMHFGHFEKGGSKIDDYYSRLPHKEKVDKEEDNE